ncbi:MULTISPECIES: ribonuclease E activity regulator RraA [unclassified Acinetobacter]|uniref:ribonuclease E activity regulator RraA n=1 Tax=unclassified Acinetobacter TaxID=196816 RepID=UPI0035B801A9
MITMQNFVTCDLLDDHEDLAIQVLSPVINGLKFQSYGGHTRFAGQAVTVKCFEDNSRVKELLATDGTGKVLIVDGVASLNCALMGDMIAESAVKFGWQGVIIIGCVRDVEQLATMDLGVYALASTPRKSVRKGVGETNIRLNIANVIVEPNDYIYADANGIIIAKQALL